jgi:hypothetical protein
MDSSHFTELVPVTSNPAYNPSQLLDSTWPVLGEFPPVPLHVFEKIKSDASGSAVSNLHDYLCLGLFLIDTELLSPHPTERSLNQDRVEELRENFERLGIHRMESPGVAIGLGDGWLQMKNSRCNPFKITQEFTHIHRLVAEYGGPVAHIIHGGHRT